MSNQSVQTVSTSNDKFKVILAVVAVIAGVVGYFYLTGKNQPAYAISAFVAGLVFAVLLLWLSTTGRDFVNFSKEAIRETRKVVWPTGKEARQITLVVFGFVVVMAIFLWGTDKILQFLLYDLILGWKN